MTLSFIPGKTVEVPEITYQPEVTLPANSTALIVMDMQNDFAGPGVARLVEPAEDTDGHLRKLFEGHELEVVAGFQERHALHREHEIQHVERFRVVVGIRIVEGERALDVGVRHERLVRHLGKAFDDVHPGNPLELEAEQVRVALPEELRDRDIIANHLAGAGEAAILVAASAAAIAGQGKPAAPAAGILGLT